MSGRIAITGATGFVGRHVVAALSAAGWQTRVLARSEPAHPLWQQIQPELVLGHLAEPAALARLVEGADVVLHLAGAIKARSTEAFMAVNRDGSLAVAEATARRAPRAHFIHVSSLAAREPALSGYCASKRAGEEAVLATLGPARTSILRPPAVYGPGDRETLAFFQLARLPWIPLLGRDTARIALIHVHDLAQALCLRAESGPSGATQGVADDRPDGYGWRDILGAAATAVGNTEPRFLAVPGGILRGVGGVAGSIARLSGQAAMFNPGKLRELLHEDWSVPRDSLMASPVQQGLLAGFASTAAWYRAEGWLRPIR